MDPQPTVAVIRGPLRYVFAEGSGEATEELFHADRDPTERENLLEELPQLASELRGRARDYLEGEPPWGPPEATLELDEIQLDQLRALGYKIP